MVLNQSLNALNYKEFNYFILKIVRYTFFFEGIGFVLLSFRFVPLFGMKGFYHALFLSVSAFCNAGIDNLGGLSLIPFQEDIWVLSTVMMLVVVGGLGFAVWFDVLEKFKTGLKKKHRFSFILKQLRLHTKVILTMNLVLWISAAVFLMMSDMNPLQAFFHSVSMRTAGFVVLPFERFSEVSRLLMLVFMFIGGSPGSTAGGIKTSTALILILAVWYELKQESDIVIFKRRIELKDVRKAITLFLGMAAIVFVSLTVLVMIEKQSFFDLLFESINAISTVGFPSGITLRLSALGRSIIMMLIFIGRIGPLTMLLSIYQKQNKKGKALSYPEADILIG